MSLCTCDGFVLSECICETGSSLPIFSSIRDAYLHYQACSVFNGSESVANLKRKGRSRDLLICTTIAFVVFCLFLGLSYTTLFRGFENKTYDVFLKLRGGHNPHPDIVLVFIGDDTLEKIGTWPITRDFYATFLHVMTEYGAKAVGFDILFSESSSEHPEYDGQLVALSGLAGNVTYPYFFYLEEDQFLPERFWIPSDVVGIGEPAGSGETEFLRALGGIFPFEELVRASIGTGHGNILADEDGMVRKSPLIIEYDGNLYPAMALSMASDLLRVERENVRIDDHRLLLEPDQGRPIRIPVTSKGEVLINYAGPPGQYTNYSFIQILQSYRQVLEGQKPLLPLSEFQDKIVLVGITATGAANIRPTPFAEHHPLVGIQANILDNILQDDFIRTADGGVLLGGILVIVLIIGGLLPFLGMTRVTTWSLLLLVLAGLGTFFIFSWANVWINVNLFWFGIVFSTLFINLYLFRRHEQEKLATERRALQLSEQLFSRQRHLDRIRGEIELREKDLQAIGDEEISDRVAKMMEERELLVRERSELEEQTRELNNKLSQVTVKLQRMETYDFGSAVTVPAREDLKGEYTDIIRGSSNMSVVLKVVDRVAPSDASVLITGESGTGKELIARAIHYHSGRKDKPLVILNSAAIPRELVESELFGHEKGSFTGATARKVGKFEVADGGTLFLDEIGDMPPATQAKLLRVIEQKEFMRVGGTETIRVNVRIVAATNKDLQPAIEAGHFREDLYHRLNLIAIHIPPLRERKADIPVLVRHFIETKSGGATIAISQEAMDLLIQYSWPGNVRELQQVIERAILLREEDIIRAEDFPPSVQETILRPEPVSEEVTLAGAIEQFERQFIIEALNKHNWNKSKTAETLKLGRRNLHKKIKKYGIDETDRL
jgi:transcriptional regulator with GAF, ATPase, and Fis domain/CHASE2 domain-containing sensor protein